MNNKHFWTIIGFLAVGVVITFLLRPLEQSSAEDHRVTNFPHDIGVFKGVDILLEQRVYDILETKNVVMRNYIPQDGRRNSITFYLIFSLSTHKTSDPPENCLIGDGMVIIEKSAVELEIPGAERSLRVNKLIAEKDGQREMYLYWFLAGNEFNDSYFKQRVKLITSAIMRKPLSGGQIRISTALNNNNEQEALDRLTEFVGNAYPLLIDLLK